MNKLLVDIKVFLKKEMGPSGLKKIVLKGDQF